MKIVLYQPQQTNKREGPQSSLDMIPLEMMHIAAFPIRDGHEVVIVDGSLYDQEEAHRRVLEACEGAGLYGSTGILGWQISDGYTCAEKVRERFPSLPRVVGGWFASVLPELELREGVFDAAVLGQGELTFRELVEAVATGSDWEDVAGLALWRDGQVHKTAHRAVVGFGDLIDPAWHLIDFEPYREGQLRADSPRHTVRMPGPPWIGKRKPYVGITYFSSFGCPEPCTFCCSPFVTNRRWKAVPADKILDDLKSLAVMRGGEVVQNPRHPVVGWDQLLNMPWHLIEDIEPYRRHQMRPESHGDILRMPTPAWIGNRKPYFGITYFSSFGCPEPCKFCCSPFVTNRRWKAMPADRMLDDLAELKERWNFDVVRFHDANFGVMEKRVKEFSEGILERGLKFGWNSFIETHSILHYKESTLDAMAASGMYVAEIGAETGTDEFMKEWVGKPIKGDDNVEATRKMGDRGIECSVTYIIGYPHESADNMLATLDQARRVQVVSKQSSPTVWPYRPIPGTEMWDEAIKLGFEPPKSLLDWGSLGEYHLHETWPGRIPPEVSQVRKLYCHYQTLARGLARRKTGFWEKLARWRLKSGNYALGSLETKLFALQNKIARKLAPQEEISRSWVDPGHKTGTGANAAATGIDQRQVVSETTTG